MYTTVSCLYSLFMDNYHVFVLTVDIYTVAIYCIVCLMGDIKFLILIEEIC